MIRCRRTGRPPAAPTARGGEPQVETESDIDGRTVSRGVRWAHGLGHARRSHVLPHPVAGQHVPRQQLVRGGSRGRQRRGDRLRLVQPAPAVGALRRLRSAVPPRRHGPGHRDMPEPLSIHVREINLSPFTCFPVDHSSHTDRTSRSSPPGRAGPTRERGSRGSRWAASQGERCRRCRLLSRILDRWSDWAGGWRAAQRPPPVAPTVGDRLGCPRSRRRGPSPAETR